MFCLWFVMWVCVWVWVWVWLGFCVLLMVFVWKFVCTSVVKTLAFFSISFSLLLMYCVCFRLLVSIVFELWLVICILFVVVFVGNWCLMCCFDWIARSARRFSRRCSRARSSSFALCWCLCLWVFLVWCMLCV